MLKTNDTGCPEYQELSRRGALSSLGSSMLDWLPDVHYSEDSPSILGGSGRIDTPPRDILVTVFLRGAADGLALCPPWKDNAYGTFRRNTRFFAPTDADKFRRVIDLDNFFGLPQSMAPLAPLYKDKFLLIAHQTGPTNANRSHFDAQHFMEVGQDSKKVWSGWMARHLTSVSPSKTGAILRGLSLSGNLPEILATAPKTTALTDLVNYAMPGDHRTLQKRVDWLAKSYASADATLAASASNAIQTMNLLQRINYPGYQPAAGVVYNPPMSSTKADGTVVLSNMGWHVTGFGESLKSAAALIKADVGIETVHVDFGGWDMHRDEWLFEGRDGGGNPNFGGSFWNFYSLAANLNAFFKDLDAVSFSDGTTLMNRVTILVMTEFGRTVNENGNNGTDHGQGGVMMFLGRNVNGGRVDHAWKGLGTTGGVDPFGGLAVTINYKVFLGELLEKRLKNPTQLAKVFPGFKKPTAGWRGAFK